MTNKRVAKAAVAGILATALLIGGGTTFAKWYEEQQVATTNIATGELSMTTVASPTWTDQTGATIDPASYLMVPGDVVTYKATTTITAIGDNLKAKLKADAASLTSDDPTLQTALQKNTVMTVTGLTDTTGTDGYSVVGKKGTTENDNGKTVNVTVTIRWPKFKDGDTGTENWGSDSPVTETGAGEQAKINLNNFKLVLEQTF